MKDRATSSSTPKPILNNNEEKRQPSHRKLWLWQKTNCTYKQIDI